MRVKAKLEILKNKSSLSTKEIVDTLSFASRSIDAFANGNNEDQKSVLKVFGSKIKLLDRKLELTPIEWLIPIRDNYSNLEK